MILDQVYYQSVIALQFAALQHFEPLFFSIFSAVTTFFIYFKGNIKPRIFFFWNQCIADLLAFPFSLIGLLTTSVL